MLGVTSRGQGGDQRGSIYWDPSPGSPGMTESPTTISCDHLGFGGFPTNNIYNSGLWLPGYASQPSPVATPHINTQVSDLMPNSPLPSTLFVYGSLIVRYCTRRLYHNVM